jgi:hypothetical protein
MSRKAAAKYCKEVNEEERMELADEIQCWREVAELRFKNMVDTLLTDGYHLKNDTLLEYIRKYLLGGKCNLSKRESKLFEEIGKLFNLRRENS